MATDAPTLFGVYTYHRNCAIRAYDKFHDRRASRFTRELAKSDNELHVACCQAIEPYLMPEQIRPPPVLR